MHHINNNNCKNLYKHSTLVVASKTRSVEKGRYVPPRVDAQSPNHTLAPCTLRCFPNSSWRPRRGLEGRKTQTINTIHCTCTKLTMIIAKNHTNLPPSSRRLRRGLEARGDMPLYASTPADVSQPYPRPMHPAMFSTLVEASKTLSGGKGRYAPIRVNARGGVPTIPSPYAPRDVFHRRRASGTRSGGK